MDGKGDYEGGGRLVESLEKEKDKERKKERKRKGKFSKNIIL